MNEALEKLLANPRIWRCGNEQRARSLDSGTTSVPTGHAELDRQLPGGGWPRQALTEILLESHGRGELRLLMPALSLLSRTGGEEEGWIAWIAPPLQPYPPALVQWGVDISRVLVVRPRKPADVPWAAEQALASGNCAAVLFWPEETGIGARAQVRPARITGRSSMFPSRRLQLAAEKGGGLGFVFRPARARSEISAAALRLELARGEQGMDVVILKNRGGRPVRIPNVVPGHAGPLAPAIAGDRYDAHRRHHGTDR